MHGGFGSCKRAVKLADELSRALPEGVELVVEKGCAVRSGPGTRVLTDGRAVAAAQKADLVIMALTEASGWTGENGSRRSLGLTGRQQELFDRVAETKKPLVAVVGAGRPLTLPNVWDRADAVLWMWQPGSAAAKGIVRVLTGAAEPGGEKLMVAVRPLSSLGAAGKACGAEAPAFFGADKTVIKVGTFNVRTADLEARDPVPWKTRAPRVVRAIQGHDFDILGLQEVTAVQLDDLSSALRRDYAYIGACRDDGVRAGEAAPVFFLKKRLELLDSGNFWLAEQPDLPGVRGWDAAFARICTWGTFKDRACGRVFAFFNTHLDHRGAVARRKGMELILSRLQPFLNEGLPGILTGDFNAVEGEEPYDVATARLRDAVRASATPPKGPWRSAQGWRWRSDRDEVTCDAAQTVPRDGRGRRAFHDRIGGSRIDHIFVSPQIGVRSVTTHTDADGRTYVSDHFPVSAVLELGGAGAEP